MRSSFALRSASAARASDAAASASVERLLEIVDARREFLVLDGERIAFERQRGVIAAQALVRRGQGLELPLRLDMGDLGALDFRQRLVDRDQRRHGTGTGWSRCCGTTTRWRRDACADASLCRPIESKVRATFRDFASPFGPVRRTRARRNSADRAAAGRRGLIARLEVVFHDGRGIVQRRLRAADGSKTAFPKPNPWRRPLDPAQMPNAEMIVNTTDHANISPS